MTAKTLAPPGQIVQLSGISWQTYENLLAEIGDRQIRLTYNRGNLKIIVPSPEHERFKEVLGRFVETLAEELDVKIEPLGSTTFKRPELSGAEPDECFYIQNISAIKGKKRIDMSQDPLGISQSISDLGEKPNPASDLTALNWGASHICKGLRRGEVLTH